MSRDRSPLAVIAKPDWGIQGGAELVFQRVATTLEAEGYRVETRVVPLQGVSRAPWNLHVPDDVWDQANVFFIHVALTAAFEELDLRDADLVVSTQPPSYAVRHPRHLSLFYHHARIYYDLADEYVRAGYVDKDVHELVVPRVREIDAPRLDAVTWFLAGSERVGRRLEEFNGLTNASVFHAGAIAVSGRRSGLAPAQGHALCVSRSEFPKRTELFVQAMAYLPTRRGVLVGTGGRLGWVRTLHRRFARPGVDLDALTAEELWLNCAEVGLPEPVGADPETNLLVAGRVDDARLTELFARASCLVAPALDEDYGLTPIEAMGWGLPAIVCHDGGGLVDLVQHEVNGLVVEPTGRAIAGAIERITTDAELAAELSEGARTRAGEFTWERARRELLDGVRRVMEA